MKKFVVFLFLVFCFPFASQAEGAANNISLKEGSTYLVIVDSPAQSFTISNPGILDIQVDTTLENERQQLIIQAKNDGVTLLSIKTEDENYDYKITVGDLSNLGSNDNFIEIDAPDFRGEDDE